MGHIYAFLTGTKVTFTSDSGDDYTDEHGWISPQWSRTELFESRNDVEPLINSDARDESLPDEVRDLIGNGLWADNGDGTFYEQDEHQDHETGSVWTYAIHFSRKRHDAVRGWIEEDWHPVTDGGIDLTTERI